jgi:hypothetical protein
MGSTASPGFGQLRSGFLSSAKAFLLHRPNQHATYNKAGAPATAGFPALSTY